MYKKFTAQDYLERHKFPENYKLEAILVYGGFKKDYYELLKKEVLKINSTAEFRFLESEFLSPILEWKIEGKNYWFILAYGSALLSEWLHIGCLFGSKKNIFLGTCGGLQEVGSSRDIILPSQSYAEESSAKCYSDTKDNWYYADKNLLEKIKLDIPTYYKVFTGKTVTHQAMLGETWEDVLQWSHKGYLGVEMEVATVFSVSSHFKVPSAGILLIGDNLIKKETVLDKAHEDTRELRRKIQIELFELAIKETLS